MDLFLRAGADPNIKNDRGETPLHCATGYYSIASLLRGKADPNIQDSEGRTPFHCLAANIDDMGDSIDLLLKNKANPNVKDSKGRTPLHYAARFRFDECGDIRVDLLLKNKADPNVRDRQGETPLQVEVNSRNYNLEKCFFTDNQKVLRKELCCIFRGSRPNEHCEDYSDYIVKLAESLREFLDKHRNDQDLKVVLNTRDWEGKSEVLENLRFNFLDSEAFAEVRDLFLEAGAIDLKELDREECFPKTRTLWCNLTPNQERKLEMFLDKVSEAQDMNKLEEVVTEAIEFGVRFNFPKRFSQGERVYNFTDRVMEKISKLENSPKVASDIVCKLISRGAVLYGRSDVDVMNALELEFKDHKTNVKKAYADYINNAHKFIKVVKRATNGRLNDVRMDNSVFYLEYSEDSTINVAMITDEAQKNIQSGKNVIKIGNSVVEIITINGIRNYIDLEDNSDITLTFPTSQGNLEVRLYHDTQNKDLIMVKVDNQDLLEQLKNCGEELGKNCLLGGYSVYNAIERGYFERSGKLVRFEVMSQSDEQTKRGFWAGRQELRKISNSGREIG